MAKPTGDHQALRDQLARTALDHIQNDWQRSENSQVRDILAYFRTHLFDRGLEVTDALKACNITSSSFATVFFTELGVKPQQYFIARRLEVGNALLLRTDIPLYSIGLLIGYSSGQAFSQAFERAKGLRPKAYRAQYQHAERSPDLEPGLYERLSRLGEHEAERAQQVLQSHHPELAGKKRQLRYRSGHDESHSSLTCRDVSDSTLDNLNAERLWSRIQGLALSQQREIIFRECQSPALFELLKSKSYEESLVDRDRGLELAWLALDAAIVAEPLQEGRGSLQAQAWAWLGNEQRLQFDLIEAERAFQIAELLLPTDIPPAVHADILQLKASLRRFQDDLEVAGELADRAIRLAEAADDSKILSIALIAHGIILAHLGRVEEASEKYCRVIQISGDAEYSLSLMASFNLSTCYWRQKNFAAASEQLEALKTILQTRREDILWIYIKEMEGRIALDQSLLDQAITKLSEAKQGFHTIKSKYAHLVGISLAIAYFLSGEPGKSFDLIGKALDTVKVWRQQPRFEALSKRLERSIASRMITLEDLYELRDRCDELSHTPKTRSQLGLKGMI